MATGVTKTFSGTAGKYVSGYGQFDLYMQFDMTETYNSATRKSDLVFSNFKIKAVDPQANNVSYVGGAITVTVNGTVHTVFSAAASAGTYKVTADGAYNSVLVNASGEAWAYTVSGVTRDAAGKLSAAVAWDGITLNNYYSGFGIAISGAETVTLTTISASYALSISAGTGSAITVSRTSSPNQGAFTGALSHGAVIYYGDVLKIVFSANTGYDLTAHTVNGSTFTSGGTLPVSAAVSVSASATPKSYTLTVNSDGHAEVTVKRGTAPLTSGATIRHFDVLSVTVSAKTGYKIREADINGTAISPDTAISHTVSGAVLITVLSEALSNVFADVDGSRNRFLVIIDDNGARGYYRAVFKDV